MNNNYIKLNNNSNHLSLGNLFNIIKKLSKNKYSAIQTELFCIIFNVDSISDTTVNNYCTGCRSINSIYKQIYLNYQKKYLKDNNILVLTVNNLLSIIDGNIYNYDNIFDLNKLDSLEKLIYNLHPLLKNDKEVTNKLKKLVLSYINKKDYYNAFVNMLFFIILDKKQPIYAEEEINETIINISRNTNISINHLKKFLEVQFTEGISLVSSLKKLAKENNPYAFHELGNMEYNGLIAGYPRYDIAYDYYLKSASYDHPTSIWMLSHMIINKKIGSLSNDDIDVSWGFLKKAESLDSISALNTIGICYLHGYTPDRKIDKNLAINYFKKAASKNYIYAFNNLGKIYEEDGNYEEAFNYYLKSAKEEESWACNKIGEYYRIGLYVKKDLQKAYVYYSIGASSPINNRCNWNIYNLVKYFYLEGNSLVNINKDLNKSISLLEQIKDFKYSNELLLYAYYNLYLLDNSYIDKVEYYLDIINKSDILNKKYKKEIESKLKDIKKSKIVL